MSVSPKVYRLRCQYTFDLKLWTIISFASWLLCKQSDYESFRMIDSKPLAPGTQRAARLMTRSMTRHVCTPGGSVPGRKRRMMARPGPQLGTWTGSHAAPPGLLSKGWAACYLDLQERGRRGRIVTASRLCKSAAE
jgi:hypothetical protein